MPVKKTITSGLAFIIMILQPTFATETITVIPEVKVTAESHDDGLNSKAETTMLSKKTIKKSPAVTLPNLLQQEQSTVRLTNNSADNSQTSLSLRGFGDNAVANTLILVDGFPLTNASLLAPNLNAINLADIERIEIIPGSQSVLWGDQAVGGVVNIITKHPKASSGTLVSGIGNENLITGYGLLSKRFDNGIYFKLSVLGFRTDHFRDHNKQHDGMLNALFGYDYENGLMQFSLNKINHSIEFPGGLTKAQYHDNPRQATTNNVANYHTETINVLSQHAFNDDWLLETRFLHQRLNGDGFINFDFDRSERQTFFHPKLIGHWRDNQIIFGFSAFKSHYQMHNKKVTNNVDQLQNDIYSQIEMPLTEKFKLTVGGRYAWQKNDAAEKNNTSWNTLNRIGVSELGVFFEPSNAWQFYLRRQGNFRFPKANEVVWVARPTQIIEPQTGVSYEAGLVFKNQQHEIQFNVYDLRLNNEIAFNATQTDTNPFGSLQNFDPTERRGFSLGDSYHWNHKLTFDAQFNYVDPKFMSGEFKGKQIPAVPRITANAGWRYAINDDWRFRHHILYTGKRYASEDLMNVTRQIPGYWLQGVALQYTYHTLELSMSVENLFNQKFSTYTIYNTFKHENIYYPGAGRNYLLTLKWNFE